MAMRYSTLGERTDMHGGDPITITFPGGRQGKTKAAHPVVAPRITAVRSPRSLAFAGLPPLQSQRQATEYLRANDGS